MTIQQYYRQQEMFQEENYIEDKSFERYIINMLSQHYRQRHDMTPVHKTLIAYKVYEEDDAKFLCDLHSIAAGIISPEVVVRGVLNTDENGDLERYNETTIEEIRNAGIKVDFIKVNSNEEENLKNIRIYEGVVNGESVRVVSVPIQKSLTNAAQAMSLQAQIKIMEFELYKETKDLQGIKLHQLATRYRQKIAQKKSRYEATMKNNHVRMFNIEALLNVVKEKTGLLSVAGLFNPKDKLQEKKKEAIRLFNIPEEATQYILHNHFNKKNLQEQKKNKSISSVWAFQAIAKCAKNECFMDSFYSKQGINKKQYIQDIQARYNNQSLNDEFVKTWSGIILKTITCIATVIDRIHEILNYRQNLSAWSLSFAPISPVYTFEEIFSRYGVRDNQNIKNNPESKLKKKYMPEYLGKIKPEKGGNIIPKSFQNIIFLYNFEKINKKFCYQYDLEIQDSTQKLFTLVFEHLKQVYELVKAINQSFDPSLEENYGKPSVYCEDIQKYFDFLDFLFQSSKLIKQITGREFALESIKSFFEQLKSRENKLLSYILSHQDDIKEGESLNYYDLYLLIIKENSKGAENFSQIIKIDNIKLYIKKLKADKISSKHGQSNKLLVEAIKTYSQIILNFNKITDKKIKEINILEIEKTIALLLLDINLPEEAAKIFMKNHCVKSAEKCFKLALSEYNGDQEAKKYIEYGKFFETQLSFAKAIDYYESAYDVAKSTKMRQQAIKTKIECSIRMQKPNEELRRKFVKFYANQCTEQQFLNTPLEQNPIKISINYNQSIFWRLCFNLEWNQMTHSGFINQSNQNS